MGPRRSRRGHRLNVVLTVSDGLRLGPLVFTLLFGAILLLDFRRGFEQRQARREHSPEQGTHADS
jgi:hypothetical protein